MLCTILEQFFQLKKVGEFLEKENIPYFLDTAQTVGCIGRLYFSNTKCNFMSFNGSKWLCGPMGTGIFYCNRNSSDLLEPVYNWWRICNDI